MRPRGQAPRNRFRAICLDWGGTLMSEDGPIDVTMARWPQVVSTDGAMEMMASLSRRFTLCIATNASVSRRPDIEQALSRAGLMRFVAEIFCFTEIGARKDNPRFWHVVTSTLDARESEIAMLGDSLEQDVLAPRRFGIRSIWFNPDGTPLPAGVDVPVARSLADVEPMLERLA